MTSWRIEPSRLGRIVIPPYLPPGIGLFSTTLDLHGRITPDVEREIAATIRERFAIDATLTTCHQIHSATVTRAHRSDAWRECDSCDALWTDEPHVALGIKVADCLPVTMVDPAHGKIANVHSGWRGTAQRITAHAIRASAIDTASSYAYLGPSIRVCCFEVGEEVVEQLGQALPAQTGVSVPPDVSVHVVRSHAKPHVDLVAITIDLLRAHGFAEDHIFDSGLCTRCDGSIFHSYRRGSGGGRNLAVVAQ